jgi:hypothetical protein
VKASHLTAFLLEHSPYLHEATRVVGDNGIDSRFKNGGAFHFVHRGGDGGEFHGKGASESATRFCFVHFDKFEPLDLFQKNPWLLLDAKLTKSVAAVMKGYFPLKLRPDIADAQNIDEEAGKFMGLCRQFAGLQFLRLPFEKIRVENLDHGDAGTGWADNHFGIAKSPHRHQSG